jgi:hypothetical protein
MTDHHSEEGGATPHTTPEEGHPAGEGERSDRDIGGPTGPEEAGDGDESGGAPGTKGSDFDSHE